MHGRHKPFPAVVMGVDLAGSPQRYSGLAVVSKARLLLVTRVKDDASIISTARRYAPTVVAIDAPFSAPDKGFREVDKAMLHAGFKVLPPSWKGMRLLVLRAAKLKATLEAMGCKVIETHPRSAVLSAGFSDAKDAIKELLKLPDSTFLNSLSKDEVDAIVSALVAKAYAEGKALAVKAVDGEIYLLPRAL